MTKINFEHLRTFLAVVRLGGVRKAAQALNVTQPAASARLKNLEETLDCALFTRSGTALQLTRKGERLLTYAEQFEHLAELVQKEVIEPEGLEGHLRLGVSETIAQCWLPEFIARLHAAYPRLQIEFNVDISVNLRAQLLNREIDLAILLGPVSEYTVDNTDLPGFDLAWYIAKDAPEEDAILTRPVLTYARNTRPYRELKDMLYERVGPGFSLFPSSSLSACFRLVEAGLGVAALPRALGQAYIQAGTIREFDPGWVPNPLTFTASYLAEPKSHMIESAAQLARQVALDHAASTLSV